MPRVLHVNDYPVESGGGAEVVMGHSVDLLRRHRVLVEMFTGAHLADPRRSVLRYIDNSQARQALAAKLDAFRPNVVHLHNIYHVLSPGILATLQTYKSRNPVRVVMTAHDYHLICPNSGGSWFRRWSGKREPIDPACVRSLGALLAHCWDERTFLHSLLKLVQHLWNYRWQRRHEVIDLVICPSRLVERMLAPTGLPTCCLPHPVAPLPFAPSGRPGPLHLVFAGRIEREKGLREFLYMLPEDFDARLTIVGEGRDRQHCQAIAAARRQPERIRFTGRLSHAETLVQVAAAHVLVQPSRVLETYGLTLIEALSAGTNILTSHRGALREAVEDAGAGYLFDVDDPASLADALAAICLAHADGTLNAFDVRALLAQRSQACYVERLLRLYRGDVAAMPAPGAASAA